MAVGEQSVAASRRESEDGDRRRADAVLHRHHSAAGRPTTWLVTEH